MSEDLMLKCLIAFVLGYLVARMMRGNGFSVGCQSERELYKEELEKAREDLELVLLGATVGNSRTGGDEY